MKHLKTLLLAVVSAPFLIPLVVVAGVLALLLDDGDLAGATNDA